MSIRNPKLSVCIPTCNRPKLFKQAIESVLAQSFSDYELIVSDNASDDTTAAVITSLKDSRIVHLRKEKRVGLVENWNSCLKAAKGPYITIFHDDDLMLPDNLSSKVGVLDRHRQMGLVHSNFNIIDEKGFTTKKAAHFINSQDFVENGLSFLRKSLLGFNPVNPPSAMIRKECFERLGGFSKKLQFTTDWEYWMRISMHYDVGFLAAPFIGYRMYHNDGWVSSRYLTIIDGETFSNTEGLYEEYTAKKMILQEARHILEDWKKLNDGVRTSVIGSLNHLIEKKFWRDGERSGALGAIVKICRNCPELMFQMSTAKLTAKALIGPGWTGRFRGLAGVDRDNDGGD